jgi:hypothetical protein
VIGIEKVNIETDTEAEVMGRTFASQNPNQAELSRESEQPIPAARDDSITAITQRTNTEDEAKITDTKHPTTIV